MPDPKETVHAIEEAAKAAQAKVPAPPKHDQAARRIVPSGRVQAPRHDSPQGPKTQGKGR